MEPLLSIQLFDHLPCYAPGGQLRCDYQIDAIDAEEILAVEASVLWHTDGKGDEDMGVHYFERRQANDEGVGDLRQLRRFQTTLPNSPLSYDGSIVKIEWCVRVRAFLKRGKDVMLDHPFLLGPILVPSRRDPSASTVARTHDR